LGIKGKPRHRIKDVALYENLQGETQLTVICKFLLVKTILF